MGITGVDPTLQAILEQQVLHTNVRWQDYDFEGPDRDPTDDLGTAEAVSSQMRGASTHRILIDIDHRASVSEGGLLVVHLGVGNTFVYNFDAPAWLVPSSTADHYHLYVDKVLEWDSYDALLYQLMRKGVIERGYYASSSSRGFTALRLPWVRKA